MHGDSLQCPIHLSDLQTRHGRVLVDMVREHQPRGAQCGAKATTLMTRP